jgi:hypothetical protein
MTSEQYRDIDQYIAVRTSDDAFEHTNLTPRDLEAMRHLRAQVAALRAEIVNLLASAHPHPVEHPTMTAAWQRARAALAHTAMGAKS